MTTETITEPEVKPKVEDPLDFWPPVQHIHDDLKGPLRKGALALCGEKLMGIYLGQLREVKGKVCEKCLKVWKERYGS